MRAGPPASPDGSPCSCHRAEQSNPAACGQTGTIIPEGYGTVRPWLISRDSAALIRFLESAFGPRRSPAAACTRPTARAGASSVTEVTELFWGDRVGRVRDPLGNVWWLQSPVTAVPPDQMQAWMKDPALAEGMRYVQETLADELRGRRPPRVDADGERSAAQ
jgi:PhnB protein